LGTSISLYHFIIDVLNYKDNRLGFKSILPIGFTFILPLLIVFLFPNIFILALNYAGAGATILFVLLPVIFIKQMIKKQHKFSMRILHNNWLLNLAFLIGVGVVLIQFLGI
jgi:amino acid permease